jgi:pectate lyase
MSALFLVLFALVVAPQMARNAFGPRTPANPTTPRPLLADTGIPVFPGAEGFGTRTPAGRGGVVIEVTSLADAGPGTLRAALEHAAPRTVVFRVGGIIELESELVIPHPFVTVAGQTAPGGGICLKNMGLTITAHDVLVQHIRVRPGAGGRVKAENNDAIQILGDRRTGPGGSNVVIDHVSASWGEDETVSTWHGAHDITISWCIVSEALNRSRHRKQTHSAGLLIGDGSNHVTVHHTLMAHNDFRNPLVIGGGTHDIVNNLIYNWGVLAGEVVDTGANSLVNFVGNAFIAGPSTDGHSYEVRAPVDGGGSPRLYVAGNIGPHRDATADEWTLVRDGWDNERPPSREIRAAAAHATAPVTVSKAAVATESILNGAGATRPLRDAVDKRVVNEVRLRTGRIIDSPRDVGGYPALARGVSPADSDHDGMPDDWEAANGLDPRDPNDGPSDPDGNGYTNLEEYLHSIS